MNHIVRSFIIGLVCGIPIFFALKLAAMAGFDSEAVNLLIVCLGGALIGILVPSGSSQPASNQGSETGTVKWFNVKKGYGFITRDSGEDIFVHYRNISGKGRRSISDGQRVKFIVIDGDKGLQADEVEAI